MWKRLRQLSEEDSNELASPTAPAMDVLPEASVAAGTPTVKNMFAIEEEASTIPASSVISRKSIKSKCLVIIDHRIS